MEDRIYARSDIRQPRPKSGEQRWETELLLRRRQRHPGESRRQQRLPRPTGNRAHRRLFFGVDASLSALSKDRLEPLETFSRQQVRWPVSQPYWGSSIHSPAISRALSASVDDCCPLECCDLRKPVTGPSIVLGLLSGRRLVGGVLGFRRSREWLLLIANRQGQAG